MAAALSAAAALAVTPGRDARPRPVRGVIPAQGPPLASLDPPPDVPQPGPEQTRALDAAARRLAPALMYVGHPKGDSGTAFVISRKHRLLATNAHVAQIMSEAGGLLAFRNGSRVPCVVERVWYHPDYARARREGVSARAGGRWARYLGALSPDLAVLQLAEGCTTLQAECALARDVRAIGLPSMPVGKLGFSGPWPAEGRPMEAAFKTGAVSLVTDFAVLGGPAPRWKMVDFNAPAGEGDSGGPIFMKDGRVIGVYAWSRRREGPEEKGSAASSAGILVDALWELLDHYGLTTLVEDVQ